MNDKALIQIVDDQKVIRQMLKDFVQVLGHNSEAAENGWTAISQMREQPPDLVLLDIMMPRMSGHEVLTILKDDDALKHIPVIVISAEDAMDNIVRCIQKGAEDYLIKPFQPEILKARITSCLEKKRLHDNEAAFTMQTKQNNQMLEERVQEQVKIISEAQLGTIFALSKLAESRDQETGEHLERMREYCRIITRELSRQAKYAEEINEIFVENIYLASPLHDIGKVGIPDRILLKPGKLTTEEFEVMKNHTLIGAETLRSVQENYPHNEFLRIGIEIAETHHEKWDGSGYPYGLKGEGIPLAGRILAVGDVYDALTSRRVYKEAYSHEKSRLIIVEGNGQHFDPDAVKAFLDTESEFLAVRQRIIDKSKGPFFVEMLKSSASTA